MTVTDLRFRKHYEEMRDLWQARILEYATGKMAHVLQSMLAHTFQADALATLFKVVYPQFKRAAFPMYVSCGRIGVDGAIRARRAEREEELFDEGKCAWSVVFTSETEMTKELRIIADAVKLKDSERVEMFKMAKSWIVCDYRQPLEGPQLDEFIYKRANGKA